MKTYQVSVTIPATKLVDKKVKCKFDIGDIVQTTSDFNEEYTYIAQVTSICIDTDDDTINYNISGELAEEDIAECNLVLVH